MTQEIPDGIQVMNNSCWRGKLSVREISMSKLAHPEGVWPEGCLPGLFSSAGHKPSSPWAQKRRSDTLGSSKLLWIIWQAQIIALRLMLSQREGHLKESLGAFIRVLLRCFPFFPVLLHVILDKPLSSFMPSSPCAGKFQSHGSGLDSSAAFRG